MVAGAGIENLLPEVKLFSSWKDYPRMTATHFFANFLIFSNSIFSSSSEIMICCPFSPPNVYISLMASVSILRESDGPFLLFLGLNYKIGSSGSLG